MTAKNPFELPLPVLADNLLPLLSSRDLTALRSVSKQAKTLVEDELLWKRKVLADFTFPAHATARMGGWFSLYRGLSHPHVYVWGDAGEGRLGIQHDELDVLTGVGRDREPGIPYPLKLNTIDSLHPFNPHARRLGTAQDEQQPLGAVVEIVAGGWSFHARSSTGRVWSWGTMDATGFLLAGGIMGTMRDPAKARNTPQLMEGLPPVQSLSGGRCHTVALTHDNRILEWRAWGTIWELEHLPAGITGIPTQVNAAGSSSDNAVPSTNNIKQLEAGWSFTAVLTHTGQIWLWYSDWSADFFKKAYYHGNAFVQDTHTDPPGVGHPTRLPISVEPLQLPPIVVDQQQKDGQEQDDGTDEIVQIAAGEDFILALTQAGALYRIDLRLPMPTAEDSLVRRQVRENMVRDFWRDPAAKIHQALMTRFVQTRAKWERLSAFEDPQSLPRFNSAWLENKQGVRGTVGKISHISAHFRQFVVFHTVVAPERQDEEQTKGEETQTLVLLGSSTSAEPQLIPELQARGVIKVTMGDYHYGALTQKGEILTWGAWSNGALGNWPPPWHPTTDTAEGEEAQEEHEEQEEQESEVGEQGESDEGDRGRFGNLARLPRVLRAPQRGGFQPRIGFVGRGRVGRAAAPPRPSPTEPSRADVVTPTLIQIHPRPAGDGDKKSGEEKGEEEIRGTPFAFDLAFAGWHSSALVLDAPPAAGN
ncbi:related to SAF1-protein involved in proteasome-dependent degradation [Sporisorium scitamineum]|uniref:Related to SAF1-protein involved in proteasome-dependent degradation n=1 Tax=Sporisorium scitamineum TaxID=49012 RepID=A0A0F7S3W9_9BASI|nr:hypothetical protein [Sporisorium scitamineum]CDS81997.1 related to SAF1-protein involved in proteasome-dependent degradation [Sporisorium scitamineum]